MTGACSRNVPKSDLPNFEDAACTQPGVDPDIFFPTTELQKYQAISLCMECPVTESCVQARLELPRESVHGVWHGVLFVGGVKRKSVPRRSRRSA